MSIWDTVIGDSLFFSKNGVSKLLDGESGPLTLDALLKEDEFIQETQSQSPKLIQFLRLPETFEALLTCLVVPVVPPHDEDRAYRFPYMACEAFACAVPGLLDELVSGRGPAGVPHLDTLFSLVLPSLRPDLHYAATPKPELPSLRPDLHHAATPKPELPPPPYLLGYWSKVVGLLCKRRPAALMRYLNLQPGIGRALAGALHNGSVATVLSASILRLPFSGARGKEGGARSGARVGVPRLPALLPHLACAARFGGMATLRLSCADAEPLPAALLHCLESALAGPVPPSVSAAGHAAAVIADAMVAARSARPHAKFLAEGYNAARTSQSQRPGDDLDALDAPSAAGSSGQRPVPSSTPAALWRRSGLGLPLLSSAAPAQVDAPLSVCNMQVDADFHSPLICASDNVPLRVLKWFRDGQEGSAALIAAAAAAVRLLAGGGSGATPPSQAACEAPFAALAAVLDATAFGYRQQATCGFGAASVDPLRGAVSEPLPIGPCPALCAAAAQQLPDWTAYLRARCGGAAAAAALPATLAAAEACAAARPPPAPSSSGAQPLGTATLALVRAICALLACPWPEVVAAAADSGVVAALSDLMLAFPWHSVLHCAVTAALTTLLSHGPPALLAAALCDTDSGGADLLQRIVAGCRFSGLPAASRAGYGGSFASLANLALALQAAGELPLPPGTLLPSALGSEWWTRFVSSELASYNIAHGLLLGGALAPDSKKSGQVRWKACSTRLIPLCGPPPPPATPLPAPRVPPPQVGANADASAKPAAVDEVAALGTAAEGDIDEDDDAGSGSDDEDEGAGQLDAATSGWERQAAAPSPPSDDGDGDEDGDDDSNSASTLQRTAASVEGVRSSSTASHGGGGQLDDFGSLSTDDDWHAGFGGSDAATSVPLASAPAAAPTAADAPSSASTWDADFGEFDAPIPGAAHAASATAASGGDGWAADFGSEQAAAPAPSAAAPVEPVATDAFGGWDSSGAVADWAAGPAAAAAAAAAAESDCVSSPQTTGTRIGAWEADDWASGPAAAAAAAAVGPGLAANDDWAADLSAAPASVAPFAAAAGADDFALPVDLDAEFGSPLAPLRHHSLLQGVQQGAGGAPSASLEFESGFSVSASSAVAAAIQAPAPAASDFDSDWGGDSGAGSVVDDGLGSVGDLAPLVGASSAAALGGPAVTAVERPPPDTDGIESVHSASDDEGAGEKEEEGTAAGDGAAGEAEAEVEPEEVCAASVTSGAGAAEPADATVVTVNAVEGGAAGDAAETGGSASGGDAASGHHVLLDSDDDGSSGDEAGDSRQ